MGAAAAVLLPAEVAAGVDAADVAVGLALAAAAAEAHVQEAAAPAAAAPVALANRPQWPLRHLILLN